MIEKKSYNPFKMWGSWVGVVIGVISVPMITWVIGMIFLAIIGLCKGEFCTNGGNDIFRIIILYIPSAVIGFFIGWGIHSLVRKLRSK